VAWGLVEMRAREAAGPKHRCIPGGSVACLQQSTHASAVFSERTACNNRAAGSTALGEVSDVRSGVTGHVETYKSGHLAAVAFGAVHSMHEAEPQTGRSSGSRARRSHSAIGSMLIAAAA